jgi:hypothetical protein
MVAHRLKLKKLSMEYGGFFALVANGISFLNIMEDGTAFM